MSVTPMQHSQGVPASSYSPVPTPPPRKSHVLRNVLILTGLVIVTILVAISVVVFSAAKQYNSLAGPQTVSNATAAAQPSAVAPSVAPKSAIGVPPKETQSDSAMTIVTNKAADYSLALGQYDRFQVGSPQGPYTKADPAALDLIYSSHTDPGYIQDINLINNHTQFTFTALSGTFVDQPLPGATEVTINQSIRAANTIDTRTVTYVWNGSNWRIAS